jgi:large subunit ribosomal protein L30
MLRIKLVRSTVAHQWRTRRVVESLGLRKINQVVEHDDTPVIRGMVHRVKELLHVEEVEGTPAKKSAKAPAKAEAAPKKAAKAATAAAEPASEEKPKKRTTKKSEEN